jgi:hypothetical protein
VLCGAAEDSLAREAVSLSLDRLAVTHQLQQLVPVLTDVSAVFVGEEGAGEDGKPIAFLFQVQPTVLELPEQLYGLQADDVSTLQGDLLRSDQRRAFSTSVGVAVTSMPNCADWLTVGAVGAVGVMRVSPDGAPTEDGGRNQ